ncbi:hypothetical protein ACMAUO_20635 [Gluconacetobacter sp. Hr-1-5]|uniref:hypothetical protein n=1 Tax=Gluconacetobacter sp. Hr-1-5 TaxID=3395370 RepID=UPI003B5203E0
MDTPVAPIRPPALFSVDDPEMEALPIAYVFEIAPTLKPIRPPALLYWSDPVFPPVTDALPVAKDVLTVPEL